MLSRTILIAGLVGQRHGRQEVAGTLRGSKYRKEEEGGKYTEASRLARFDTPFFPVTSPDSYI